ncbi:acyl-CoA synthetase [Tsukamurella sp. 8F]|uniref:acyl-CoA synthetase n=1 Tax=unclassified Tsukamurella TaxID=2633480 RepID=UPI0023B96FDE|nr:MULTISPECIES: acyl-CoA synthetase [unclassified Tsukamurella]MDF0530728.1 acyl-CoA synthetase [Tsukamurella sp. 8J]MDF0587929.1 acyl-CoA synthetase [Tsukamurella sp. 8F]
MSFNVADLLEHAVDAMPDRTALVCGDRSITYRELDERANRLAHHLAAQGLGVGDHVGVYSRNSIESIETMFAAFKLRAIPVNVNYRYVADELRHIFTNADLEALVFERRFDSRVAEVLPDAPLLTALLSVADGSPENAGTATGAVDYEEALAARSADRDFAERSPDDLYILYTGGTTGRPKGVMWRQEDVYRALGGGINFITGEYVEDEYQPSQMGSQGPGMVAMPVSPLIHGAAQWATMMSLFGGGKVVLVPQFDADAVWRAVQDNKVQVLTVVGDAMARPLMDAYKTGRYDASSLISFTSHAALFSQSLKEEYLETFPNLFLTDAIGSSESGFVGLGVVTRGVDYGQGPRVNPSAQAALIDDDGALVSMSPGATGRMARTGHVPIGYYKDPEKSATIFAEIDGRRYVIPGDYARYEDDGTLTLLGRGSGCVNTGGEKVFPEEVEGALKSHPDVFDALVVGVPDDRLGQRVGALIQAREDVELDIPAVLAQARTRIAGYKLPRSVWIVDRVHRQPSGKPDYPWAKRHTTEVPETAIPAAQ